MSSPFFISKESQQSFFFVLRVIFCVSIGLHSISLVFLTRHTPRNQITWRNYMLFVQVVLITIDVYMEMLFVMVPLFPAPCGFSTGPLCKLGVPLQIQTGIGFLLMGYLFASIVLCVFHRHQSILITANPFRFGKIWNRAIHVALIVAMTIPNAYFCSIMQDQKVTEETVRMDKRNLTWIMDRGCYICIQKTIQMKIFVVQVLLTQVVSAIWLTFMFVHMRHVLNIDNHIRSGQTTQKIRKSVIRLFFQLITPLLLMAVPATVIVFALAADDLSIPLISFEQSMFLFTVILCHPIAHNILLLSLTPAYRKTYINFLKQLAMFKSFTQNVRSQPTTTIVPYDAITTHRFVKI